MSGGFRAALVLLALVVAATVVAAPGTARPQAERTLTAQDDLETSILREINAFRRAHGLAPLRLNVRLRAAADAHSTAMVTRGFFAHASADGTSFWQRVARYYPRGGHAQWSVGENLLWASGDLDAKRALRMWLNSPPHRKILLTARWREIGLSAVHSTSAPGVYRDLPVTVVTADFGVRR
jgi:uncharacterized protein YkwD